MSDEWLRLQFRVDASYFDKISDLLEVCLALSISIENDGEDEFFEVAFPQRPTWNKIRVSALFFAEVDAQAIIDFIQSTLFKDHPVPVIVEKMQDQDWERVWLEQFEPIHIAHDLWIVPSWLEAPDKNAKNIRIDPGLAFGTGTHATTFLCLEYLAAKNLNNKKVLDFGAGSGILGIASLLQDAASTVAVDIDPLAVKACEENANSNNVSNSLRSISTEYFLNSDLSETKYDLVIANILAEVLIDNAQKLLTLVEADGQLLLSGILSEQRKKIILEFDRYAKCDYQIKEKDGWLLIIVEKKSK